MPNLAALSQDSLSAREVINMHDTADSAVTKMKSLNISNSTSAGCSKSEELPKDRFTRVNIYFTSSTMQLLYSKDMLHAENIFFDKYSETLTHREFIITQKLSK